MTLSRRLLSAAAGAGGWETPLDLDWDHAYATFGPLFVAEGYTNGAAVDVWPDEVGGVNLVQATGANQPLYVASLAEMGGIGAVRGNGAAHHMRTADWTDVNQPVFRLTCERRRIRKNDGAFCDGKQSTTKGALAVINGNGIHLDFGDNAGVSPTVSLPGEGSHLFGGLGNGSGSKAWLGGRNVWSGTLAADASEGITILDSAELSGGAKSLDGEVCFIGERYTEPSADEWAFLADWFAGNAGCENHLSGIRRLPDRWSRAANESDGSLTKTLVASPTAGNLLVCSMLTAAADSTHSVTDNLGGTWTKQPNAAHTLGARGVSIWTKTAVGTETTVTMAGGTGLVQGQVDEVAGWTGTFIGNNGEDAGVGRTDLTPTVDTSAGAANQIIFAVIFTDGVSGQVLSSTNGWNVHDGNTGRCHTMHKVVATAAAHSSTLTWTTARRCLWAALAIAAA